MDLFYAEKSRKEAGPAPEDGRALAPSFRSPLPAPERYPSIELLIAKLSDVHRAPVTVIDEDVAARRRPRRGLAAMETRGFSRVCNRPHSHSHPSQNRIPALREICSAGDSAARELNHSAGSVGIELILSDTNGSSRLSRIARGRAPRSIKRDLREDAEVLRNVHRPLWT